MNIDKIAADIGIDTQTMMNLIDLFVKQTAVDLADIETAMAEKKWEEVKKSAHSIKGAALNLELQDIAEKAKEVENSARSGQTELIPASVAALNGLFGDLKKSLPGVSSSG